MIGQEILTPYGQGIVKEIRQKDSIVLVEPKNWLLANKKPPTFYLNPKDVKSLYNINDKIHCSFGAGTIHEIRTDGIYVVKLGDWKLADGKSPTLYLNQSSLKIAKSFKEDVKKMSHTDECLEKSLRIKTEATLLFEQKDYAGAKTKYFEALSALQVIGNLYNIVL